MIKYAVRSVALLNIVNDVKADRLVPDAYFQRNLVWRELHKREFIESILLGYPFPQMFISRGKIDVEKMTSVACIVDGQQRTNAIMMFVNNELAVGGRYFRDLTPTEKSEFFKYEIAIVELDLDNDSPHVKEIFKRLNRTSNSLTTIEKLASEYAATEFMYVARLLSNDADPSEPTVGAEAEEDDWRQDPNLPEELMGWAKAKEPSLFEAVTMALQVFTEREIARKVHIMYALNIMSTVLGGFFNRNESTTQNLEDFKEEFPEKDRVYDLVKSAIDRISGLQLPAGSLWTSKASFFTLTVAICQRLGDGNKIAVPKLAAALMTFAGSPTAPYLAAARDSVNDKKQRTLRHRELVAALGW